MKRIILTLMMLTIWSSAFAAYYQFKPHGEFNWNNVGTNPDSVRLIDWTLPDTFYHASANINYLGGGAFEFDSSLSVRGWHDLTWVIYYASATVAIRDNFRYEVKDTLPQSFAVNLDNATGTLSDAQIDAIVVGSVSGNVDGNVTGAINLDNATGTLSDAQVDNITVTAGTVSDKANYSLSPSQTFNNTGTWAGNITGNLSGSVGSVTGNVGGNVVGSVASVSGSVGSVTGNVAGSVASVTGAVGSVTGNVGGNVTGSVGTVNALAANVITAASIADGTFALIEFGDDFLHEVALRADSGQALMLTDADIDSIVVGVLAGGVAIDTAALRANLQNTPMIIGTNNDKADYQLAVGAITSAVIAASGSHAIALASDSGGLVLVDYNIIASTNYDYFTYGNREDAFKSGAGAGPDTTYIYVLAAEDSAAVVGAHVSYFIGSSKLTVSTDSTGLTVFGALPGTYTAVASYDNRYTTTALVTAGTFDTLFMTQPTIPEPTDTLLTGVWGYLKDLNGDPLPGIIVKAVNQGNNIRVGNVVISKYEVADTTDAAGYWSMPLYATVTLGGTSYKYTFSQYIGTQSIINRRDITVPDTTSWNFTW